MDTGPGRPSEPKEERLGYQSAQPGSPPEPTPSPLLADGHYPAAPAKPEPPPACLCPTPGCDGCPGVPNPFEPTLGMAGGRFPCPPSNHTKLKKTWLTRHSEQSLPRSKVSRRDGGPEPPGEGKRSAKRPHGTAEGPRAAGEGAGAAKRGTKATACPGDGTGDPEDRRMELGDGGEDEHDAQRGRGRGRGQRPIPREFCIPIPGAHSTSWEHAWAAEPAVLGFFPAVTGPGTDRNVPLGTAWHPRVGFPGGGSAVAGSVTPRGGVGIPSRDL